jgi:hypothetical protein
MKLLFFILFPVAHVDNGTKFFFLFFDSSRRFHDFGGASADSPSLLSYRLRHYRFSRGSAHMAIVIGALSFELQKLHDSAFD